MFETIDINYGTLNVAQSTRKPRGSAGSREEALERADGRVQEARRRRREGRADPGGAPQLPDRGPAAQDLEGTSSASFSSEDQVFLAHCPGS